jgi:hypothetical protein
MTVKADTIYSGYSVYVTFTGTEAECDVAAEKYLQSYHPCGYGTRIERKEKLEDGNVKIYLSRSHSCD